MTDTNIPNLKNFFERYSQVEQSLVEGFQNKFQLFSSSFNIIHDEILEEARLTASGFNIFEVLGLARSENRTHSALLAHLLRPGNSHGQQYLFLKSFLEFCSDKYPKFPLPAEDIETGRWIVKTEIEIPNGRIDIYIESPDLNCVYVIENKIDAGEQPEQLRRYGSWMNSISEKYPIQALIFLTIRGDESITSHDILHFPLSYHEDISSWLGSLLPEIPAQNLREVITQYRNLANQL